MDIFVKSQQVKPTKVYDTYWRFAAERQGIFFKRFRGESSPWTDDPILAEHKFTNAYRASDRVSQYLIQNVIYQGDQSAEEMFFRCILFKVFNRISTWELLESALGQIRYSDYEFGRYDHILESAMRRGERIFSAAYIMPTHAAGFRERWKHRNYLALIEKMMNERVPARMSNLKSMGCAFELLHSYPLIGSFLAYQFTIDLNYSTLTDFSESEFVVPGPGARDGIRKCFESPVGMDDADLIRLVTDRQNEEFARLGLNFQSLWGRPLQLIDCQNLFCEVDKYARLAHPEIRGITARTRIKQKFTPNSQFIHYRFPPKWGINEAIYQLVHNSLGQPPM